jgi:hypothetical protein
MELDEIKYLYLLFTTTIVALFFFNMYWNEKKQRVWWLRSNSEVKSWSFGFKPVLKIVVIIVLAALIIGLVTKDWN